MKINRYKCPVCKNSNTTKELTANNYHGNHLISKKESYSYYRCGFCSAVFLIGVKLDKKYFQKNYNSKYFQEVVGIKGRMEKIYSTFSNIKKRHLIENIIQDCDFPKPYKLLDIGAGNGGFLKGFDIKKYDLYGVEKGNKIRLKGIKMYNADIYEFKTNYRFSLISLWHVLEHLDKPNKLFGLLNNLLDKKGYVAISTPNTESLGFRKSGNKWYHLDAPRHLILYSEKTMRILAEENGFIVERVLIDKFEYPLDLYWSLLSRKTRWLYLSYIKEKLSSAETKTYILTKK